jgi:uncharacterized protein YigA (DUF484 family)
VLEKLMDISVLRNENERLKEQLARTQAALAESEEARQRLETIVVDMRREKFGAKSEKLRPDQFHLPLEDVEIAQGVLDAAQEKAAAIGRTRRTVGFALDERSDSSNAPTPMALAGVRCA